MNRNVVAGVAGFTLISFNDFTAICQIIIAATTIAFQIYITIKKTKQNEKL